MVVSVDVAERGGADDHPLGPRPQRLADRGEGAQAAAVLHGRLELGRHPPQLAEMLRGPPARAVEVDDVEVLRPLVGPGSRGLERRLGVDRLLVEVAEPQPDRAAALDVDRREEDHGLGAALRPSRRGARSGRPQSPAKEPSRASPSGPDFSGWNCTPNTVCCATTEANSVP